MFLDTGMGVGITAAGLFFNHVYERSEWYDMDTNGLRTRYALKPNQTLDFISMTWNRLVERPFLFIRAARQK